MLASAIVKSLFHNGYETTTLEQNAETNHIKRNRIRRKYHVSTPLYNEADNLQEPNRLLTKQHKVLKADCIQYKNEVIKNLHYTVASIFYDIEHIALASIAMFLDIFKCFQGRQHFSVIILNLIDIPLHVGLSVVSMACSVANCALQIIEQITQGIGLALWHIGEFLTNQFNQWNVSSETPKNYSVLSQTRANRKIVYQSLGYSASALAACFIPIPGIQLLALPIIAGSIYGTLNNVITNKRCPQYYTMGHYYAGDNLEGHATQTNHCIVKPIVTGCYATVGLSKIVAVAFAAIAMAPFFGAALTVGMAATMIAVVSIVSICASQAIGFFVQSQMDKSFQKLIEISGLNERADIINEMRYEDFIINARNALTTKLDTIAEEDEKQEHMRQFEAYKRHVENFVMENKHIPIKHLSNWQANALTNLSGYLTMGIGSIAIMVSTIALRIVGM